jgi:hypothetical protein
MASTVSKRQTELSFAISYGLAGGRSHGRKFSKLLQQAGWKPARHIAEATIIIAHSAGCWLMPPSAQPKLVIYVGMPLAQAKPRRTWAVAKKMAFQKAGLQQTSKDSLQNVYYVLRQPRRNMNIIRRAKIARPVIFSRAQSVFIANRYDPWPQSKTLQIYLKNQDWAFISLPGIHDDIWEHPEHYTAIINHYARLLG